MATRELLAELADRAQGALGYAITAEAAGGVDVAKRVQAGESFDVVVLSREAIERLIESGRLLRESRVDLAKSGVAVAVRAGAPRPDITSEQAVKAAVLSAQSVSYSTGPSGVYLEKLFARWGILEQIRARIVVAPPGIPVGSLVAKGSAQLGFQQLSELLHLAGIEVVGSLPESIQTITVFSGAIAATCVSPTLARALLDYMAAPETAALKQSYGMDSV